MTDEERLVRNILTRKTIDKIIFGVYTILK